jgi:hypothetical protein
MPQNETPYYPPQENNLNGQGSFSGQPTIPSHIFPPVSEVTYGTINNSVPQFFIDNLNVSLMVGSKGLLDHSFRSN